LSFLSLHCHRPRLDDCDPRVLHGEDEVDEEDGGRYDAEHAQGQTHVVVVVVATIVLVVYNAQDARSQEERKANKMNHELLK
jgi:hypothetical protein